MRYLTNNFVVGALGACVLVFAFYFPVFFGPFSAVNLTDGSNLYLERYTHYAHMLKTGQMPAWNPYPNLGQIATDGSGNPFFLVTLLFLFFKPWTAHSIFIIGGFWGLFLCTWLYLRHLGLNRLAAAAGCLIYGLSGPVMFIHSYIVLLPAMLFLPLALLFLSLWHRHGKFKYIALLCLAIICACLLSQIDMVVYFLFAISIYYLALGNFPKSNFMNAWWGGAFLILMIGVAAFYFYPLSEWIETSSRGAMSYGDNFFPSALNLVTAVSSGRLATAHSYSPDYFYIGVSSLILAMIGFLTSSKNFVRIFCMLSLVFPLRYIIFYALHIFEVSFMQNADHWRGMFVFMFALGILGAQGTEYLLKTKWIKNGNIYARYFFCGIIFISFLPGYFLTKSHILTFCIIRKNIIKEAVLYWQDVRRASANESGAGRITGIDRFINTAMLANMRVLPAYANLYNRDFHIHLKDNGPLASEEKGYKSLWWRLQVLDAKKLAYYGVQYLFVEPNRQLPKPAESMWHLREDLSFRKGPYLYENIFFKGRAYVISPDGVMTDQKVRVEDVTAGSVDCRIADARSGDRLVLADQAYPGWSVMINDIPAKWQTYRGCLMSVALQEGSNTVRWHYASGRLRTSAFISLFSCALLLIALFIVRKRTQKGFR